MNTGLLLQMSYGCGIRHECSMPPGWASRSFTTNPLQYSSLGKFLDPSCIVYQGSSSMSISLRKGHLLGYFRQSTKETFLTIQATTLNSESWLMGPYQWIQPNPTLRFVHHYTTPLRSFPTRIPQVPIYIMPKQTIFWRAAHLLLSHSSSHPWGLQDYHKRGQLQVFAANVD